MDFLRNLIDFAWDIICVVKEQIGPCLTNILGFGTCAYIIYANTDVFRSICSFQSILYAILRFILLTLSTLVTAVLLASLFDSNPKCCCKRRFNQNPDDLGKPCVSPICEPSDYTRSKQYINQSSPEIQQQQLFYQQQDEPLASAATTSVVQVLKRTKQQSKSKTQTLMNEDEDSSNTVETAPGDVLNGRGGQKYSLTKLFCDKYRNETQNQNNGQHTQTCYRLTDCEPWLRDSESEVNQTQQSRMKFNTNPNPRTRNLTYNRGEPLSTNNNNQLEPFQQNFKQLLSQLPFSTRNYETQTQTYPSERIVTPTTCEAPNQSLNNSQSPYSQQVLDYLKTYYQMMARQAQLPQPQNYSIPMNLIYSTNPQMMNPNSQTQNCPCTKPTKDVYYGCDDCDAYDCDCDCDGSDDNSLDLNVSYEVKTTDNNNRTSRSLIRDKKTTAKDKGDSRNRDRNRDKRSEQNENEYNIKEIRRKSLEEPVPQKKNSRLNNWFHRNKSKDGTITPTPAPTQIVPIHDEVDNDVEMLKDISTLRNSQFNKRNQIATNTSRKNKSGKIMATR